MMMPSPELIILFFSFAFGACLGSFFNVVDYRVPLGLSVVQPRSFCPTCNTPIASNHNIPILGYLLLRGKCAHCHTSISIQYPLLEALSGFISLLLCMAWIHGVLPEPRETQIGLYILGIFLFPMSWIDFRHYLLPDVYTLTGLVIGLAVSFLSGGLPVWQSFLGAALPAAVLYLLGKAISQMTGKEAMGLGDVKLLAMGGAFFGPIMALLGLFFAAVLGMLYALGLKLGGRWRENRWIPFGPFLGIGLFIAGGWGTWLWQHYLLFLDTFLGV